MNRRKRGNAVFRRGRIKKRQNEQALEKIALWILRKLKKQGWVSVAIVDDRELLKVKRRFLKVSPGSLNVLAFPEPEGFPHPETGGKNFLGEIYLAQSLLKKESRRTLFFLIHGILHVAGFNHERKRDTIAMERLEARLLPLVVKRFPSPFS